MGRKPAFFVTQRGLVLRTETKDGMFKTIENKISDLIAGAVEAAGYELVRVMLAGRGSNASIQVMVERKDGAGMIVDDCASVSSLVLPVLEADEALAGKYDLEVSSPGIDRPLVKAKDFARFLGNVAQVELRVPVDGRRRFQGRIADVSGEDLTFELDKGDVFKTSFADVERAKLVLTDALLKAALSGKAKRD